MVCDSVLDNLRHEFNDLSLYYAGLPGFPRNFSRDSIISALLMEDMDMLKNQLIMCASKQGSCQNSYTGEEPGKIFHEFPGVNLDGKSTLYNACDTTALFLIGHESYLKKTGDDSLLISQYNNVLSAIEYIKSHLNQEGGFFEDPSFCGAKEFALKVTYWKDSELANREEGKPVYPVVYALAHAQNLRGLKSGLFLTNDGQLEESIQRMRNYFNRNFFKNSTFFFAIDDQGKLSFPNSDVLHILYYLDCEDISSENLSICLERSSYLETEAGYRALGGSASKYSGDYYHSNTVWPFEQAAIHYGAKKFGLDKVKRVSFRVFDYLDTSPEILIISDDKISKGNNDPQLWTIAAKGYFEEFGFSDN